MKNYDELKKVIETRNKFAIVSHTSPDGDSMGSILSFYNILKENNKNVDVFVEGQAPNKFSYLSGFFDIKSCQQAEKSYDCLIVLDCGDKERLGDCTLLFDKAAFVVNIDHHITNTEFGNINIIDDGASSVGEMLFEIYKQLGYAISKNTAECLYTSIVSDTGGFKFSNTTSKTMKVVSEIIDLGIDFTEIYDRLFNTKTLKGIKLTSLVTSTLKLHLEGKVATMYLTKNMLDETGASEDDAGELVNIARDIENVEVGILVKEIDKDVYKLSLRSKKYFDVRNIALKYGGGGHIKAAGCTIKNKTISEIIDQIVKEVEEQLEE